MATPSDSPDTSGPTVQDAWARARWEGEEELVGL